MGIATGPTFKHDHWDEREGETAQAARSRYNESTPLTVVLVSREGFPLAVGGEQAARSADALRSADLRARVCVAGHKTAWRHGERPPPIEGITDLPDCSWNRWCCLGRNNGSGLAGLKAFQQGVAGALCYTGVLVYCKDGAERSAAATVSVAHNLTASSVAECVAHIKSLRKIVDLYRWSSTLEEILEQLPKSDPANLCKLPVIEDCPGSQPPQEATVVAREPAVNPGKKPGGVGYLLCYNQDKTGLAWPTLGDGAYNSFGSVDSGNAKCYYGWAPAAGAPRGGVPFAIVEAVPGARHSRFVGYRYWSGSSDSTAARDAIWTPFPQAAYCWREGAPRVQLQGRGEIITIEALIESGEWQVLKDLHEMAEFIGGQLEQHVQKTPAVGDWTTATAGQECGDWTTDTARQECKEHSAVVLGLAKALQTQDRANNAAGPATGRPNQRSEASHQAARATQYSAEANTDALLPWLQCSATSMWWAPEREDGTEQGIHQPGWGIPLYPPQGWPAIDGTDPWEKKKKGMRGYGIRRRYF